MKSEIQQVIRNTNKFLKKISPTRFHLFSLKLKILNITQLKT